MMIKIDWKDIFKSWITMTLSYIGMVISWLLFTWTSLLCLLSYMNNSQDMGLIFKLGLLIVAILFWVVAVTLTIKTYNIVTRRGTLNGKTTQPKDFEQ